MRGQFKLWLTLYKEYKTLKINNVLKAIDSVSDDSVQNGIIESSLFSCDNYISYAKNRQKITKSRSLSDAEVRALNLLGDFYQVIEYTSLPYSETDNSELYEYCRGMKMSYSYKPVLLLILIENGAWQKPCNLNKIVSCFCDFYLQRLQKGQKSERDNSVFSNKDIDFGAAKNTIINNPLAVLVKDHVLYYDKNNDIIGFTAQYTPNKDEIEKIKTECINKIEQYYASLEDKTNTAVDDNNPEVILDILQDVVLQMVTENDLVREAQIHIDALKQILLKPSNTESLLLINEDDDRSIGKLVKDQMQLLSESGYEFDPLVFEKLCSKEWSKQALKLYYPMFKEYLPNVDLSSQIRDYNGNGRYWTQVFIFGNRKVLITSEWFKYSKPFFIEWYNKLVIDIDVPHKEKTKTEDKDAFQIKENPRNEDNKNNISYNRCVDRVISNKNKQYNKLKKHCIVASDLSEGYIFYASKSYIRGNKERYWFGLRKHQLSAISQCNKKHLVFACGSEESLLILPLSFIESVWERLSVSYFDNGQESHRHININKHSETGYSLILTRPETEEIDISKYLLGVKGYYDIDPVISESANNDSQNQSHNEELQMEKQSVNNDGQTPVAYEKEEKKERISALSIVKGARVRHNKFGTGTITSVDGQCATIKFDKFANTRSIALWAFNDGIISLL